MKFSASHVSLKLLCLLALPALLAACGAARDPEQSPRVTVGYIPILISAPLYIAADKGYFEEEGLDVRLEPLAGGADMLTQTAAGNFQVGAGGIGVAAFNAFARGLDFKIVAPLHAERPPMTTPLLASKRLVDDGQISSIEDLRGKPVAINARGAATEYWLDAALRSGGLTINDVDLQAIPFDVAVSALDEGAIAASMMAEPLATLAVANGAAVMLSDDFLEFATPTAVYFNGDFAEQHPDAAERFMAAYLRASRDLHGDGALADENVAIIEKYTGVPADVVKMAAAPYHEPNGVVDVDDLHSQQEFFRDQGLLTYLASQEQQAVLRDLDALRPDGLIDLAKMVDDRFARAAVEALGEFDP